MKKKKLVYAVLALVFVGSVAVGGRDDQVIYSASSSPTLDVVRAGSATAVELVEPKVFWGEFFAVVVAVAAVYNAYEKLSFLWAGGTAGGNTQYAGVSEAIFD